MGLETFGAQLSLLGRQVASSLNAILPADLNPFVFDEEDYDEDELAAAAAARWARRARCRPAERAVPAACSAQGHGCRLPRRCGVL